MCLCMKPEPSLEASVFLRYRLRYDLRTLLVAYVTLYYNFVDDIKEGDGL